MNYRVLSPSPIQEVFSEIRWNDISSLESLGLTSLEQTLLTSGEANPIEYTLSNNDDAIDFIRLLLKVLDQVIAPIVRRSNSFKRVSQISLEESIDRQSALEWLERDTSGVVKHFVISKLCESVDCIRSGNVRSVSVSSTFFRNGYLLEGWSTLMQLLDRGGSDVYTLRKRFT